MQSTMKPIPLSPDPGYLEALNGYFPQSHLDYVPIEETRPGDESHTEDEEDEGNVQDDDEEISLHTQHLAQNCSRMAIPPANDGVITTPLPQPRIAHLSRRRRHSCVEPNTKEFHTLATIFGWVTMSAQDAWPKILGKQLDETTEIKAVLPTQRCGDVHPAVCESDDNSDFDGSFRYGEMMEWSLSRESRDSEFTDSRFQSPNGSMELLAEFGNLSLDASLVHQGGSNFSQHQARHLRSGLSGVLRDRQALVSAPEMEQNEILFSAALPSTFKPQRDCTKSPPNSITYNAPLDINTLPREQSQDGNLSSVVTENFVKTGRRQRSLEISLLCKTACSDGACVENPLNSSISRTIESSLMSPLSFSSGKDSGYMSIACSFLNSSAQSFAIDIEQNINDIQKDHNCQAVESELQIDNDFSCANADRCLSNVEPMPDVTSAPHIPPWCPENDAQGFDHAEDEGPDTIVYAPLEGDHHLGNYELRPIVAATVAKLIEKLTHQYGMDSGFVSDFFLTYRLFMSPMQLCKYLIQRYLWSLEQDIGTRHIVRVRTFVVIRYWINKHFEDDFLPSKALRFQMESFLREVRSNPRVQTSAVDSRIILSLSDFYKRQRRDYKALAERVMMDEQKHDPRHKMGQGISHSDLGYSESDDMKVAEVERLGVSAIRSHIEPLTAKTASSDVAGTKLPIKGRNRASTLASTTSRSMVREAHGSCPNYKPPLSSDSRATSASMSRQMSEGGAVIPRERRLSTSSIKTHKSGSTWSNKVTLGINKLRQKSEDIYQQLVHSANAPSKSGDSRTCVCWTPAYTGITEHHALNTTRSYPCLRPSVVVANVSQELFSPQSSAGYASSVHPSNKSIKRLKSSISLGRSSPVAELSPVPSPTRNQFSSISARHSRSNSNSSMGYHPNPDCPFHVECLGVVSTDAPKKTQESLGENISTTLQEALQDDFADILTRPTISRVQTSIPSSPGYNPWFTAHQSSSTAPVYKPFILYYRSQLIAQQLCLLEQHFLEQIRWDELLEVELTKAGRRNRSKCQFSIGGYLFKTERERNGVDESNERSNMLCMWVASEVVSTHPIEDRVRVIEKFIRIAQKCHQYRNYNSLFHLVMGLGSSHLCTLRRTWSRVRSYEMRILQELQHFILPYSNWGLLRKAMNQVDYQETLGDSIQRFSVQGQDSIPSSRGTADEQGCIPFLGLFIFDLTHISVSSPWYLPQTSTPQDEEGSKFQGSCSLPPKSVGTNDAGIRLQAPDPKDVQKLIPTGKLLVHFHRYKLIAKTIKWFMAFQRRSQKYTFAVDSTLYSKCFLLRVLSDERVRELADSCEGEYSATVGTGRYWDGIAKLAMLHNFAEYVF
ncbi:Guanine nucleotide exchange factor lte1 [Mortierella sp. AD094]|nr:Guanine nucleotide exchange factor lte1 [Mortierella sp. AD094]